MSYRKAWAVCFGLQLEKKTEYDEVANKYTCTIRDNVMDETEVIIRVLSFGPTIKVLGPNEFVVEIRNRVKKQSELIRAYEDGVPYNEVPIEC